MRYEYPGLRPGGFVPSLTGMTIEEPLKTDVKSCFGDLNRVFPLGGEGLREIVPGCFKCPDLKACLQAALGTEQGLVLKMEALDRIPATGLVGRVKRWSERKALWRRMTEAKRKNP